MNTFLTLCACLTVSLVIAQKNETAKNDAGAPEERKGYIGLSLGVSIPLGSFASKDNFDPGTGLTGPESTSIGLQLNLINFGYLFSEHVGIAATWFGAAYPRESNRNYELDPWSCGGIMVGPLFSFPLSEKAEWDIRPMFGYSVSSGQPEDASNTVKSSRSGAIGLDVGTLLRIHAGRKASLLFNADYIATKLKFENSAMTPGADEQPIRALSLGVGLAMRLK